MSGIIGSKFNHRGSGLVGSLGTDGQHLLSSGAGKKHVFETVAAADLTPVRQDILTLALKQAVQENHTKYNLPNSALTKFEEDADYDSSGSTDTVRAGGEYLYCQVAAPTRTVSGNETGIVDGDYTIYKWLTSGGNIVIADGPMICDYLVVGGGGGGGGGQSNYTRGGGGGGGAYYAATNYSLAVGTYAITIGAGGNGGTNYNNTSVTAGGSTIFGSIQTAGGGGHGGVYSGSGVNSGNPSDASDGSGGGAGGGHSTPTGATGGAGGNDGGDGVTYTGNASTSGGGGGGAAAVGAAGSGGTAGAGGAGTANSITGSSETYASGGGGGGATGGAGGTNAGSGGSGNAGGSAATDGYGGGGGGASYNTGGSATGGAGGDGIVIIRSLTTLPSGSTTATALGTTNVPTSAVTDVSGVMLLKDAYGSTTLGTDVKAYFTADNSNWTEADSYADAGTFSTGIKMIKLGKATCTSGSDVRWKIALANQVADSKIAHIYGIGINY